MHALIDIEVTPAAGVPYTIAESAAELSRQNRRAKRNSYEKRDEIWAAFDRDAHPRYEEAIALCHAHGVNVARSNPCFEVWLILHEQDYDKPDGRHSVQAHLQSLRPEYDPNRGKTPNCVDLITRIKEAERRAAVLCSRRENEGAPFGAASTTVHLLTQRIRTAAEESSPKSINGLVNGQTA
jgi:hypothetical protein